MSTPTPPPPPPPRQPAAAAAAATTTKKTRQRATKTPGDGGGEVKSRKKTKHDSWQGKIKHSVARLKLIENNVPPPGVVPLRVSDDKHLPVHSGEHYLHVDPLLATTAPAQKWDVWTWVKKPGGEYEDRRVEHKNAQGHTVKGRQVRLLHANTNWSAVHIKNPDSFADVGAAAAAAAAPATIGPLVTMTSPPAALEQHLSFLERFLQLSVGMTPDGTHVLQDAAVLKANFPELAQTSTSATGTTTTTTTEAQINQLLVKVIHELHVKTQGMAKLEARNKELEAEVVNLNKQLADLLSPELSDENSFSPDEEID